MRLSFKQRMIGYFLVIFAIYAISVVFFEQQENKKQKTDALQSNLDGYTELVHHYIEQNKLLGDSITAIGSIVAAMPDEVRVTIIDADGKVLYDNDIKNYNTLENHLDRIEIKGALYQNYGTNIRESSSVHKEYLYHARYYNSYFVRVALPYNVETKNLLKADSYFVYITILLSLFILILLYVAANRFNRSILDLKNLTRKVKRHEELPRDMDFPNDELGDIGKELVHILEQKDIAKQEIETEREKLRQHFQYTEEGLAIFGADFKKEYVNTHFIQYANILAVNPVVNVNTVFDDAGFCAVTDFLRNRKKDEHNYQTQIKKDGKIFVLKTIIFYDNSFELTIRDITAIEKNRILKQEMTSNIAHELRTPVTALRGFLETMSEQDLAAEKQKQFIEKAYAQSIRLSDLIEDISLLTKIEEQENTYTFETINMSLLVDNIQVYEKEKLIANGSQLHSTIGNDILVKGNYNLLLSVLQNLVENSLKYAGEKVDLYIDRYTEDNEYHYFTYYDTGKGVEDKHLNRIFERFYRVDEGRDRTQGGSGLGLSIVRNIIILHKGDIQAKKYKNGGLQFLFKLPKSSNK